MRHRHPVPLDVRAAHRGGVQQEVDEVVVQQVDLVDVEHAPVRLGEQPGLVGADALGQRALQVQRPDQPVLGGARRAARPAARRGRARSRAASRAGPGRPACAPRRRRGRVSPNTMTGPGAACGPSGQRGSGAAGSQENRQSGTTATSGSSAASARTAVDFAVPFSPRTSTPPTPGCTALSSNARRRSSWPTTAENGNRTTALPSGATRGTEEVTAGSLPDRRSPSGGSAARRDR